MHPKIQENNDRLLAILTDEILALRKRMSDLEDALAYCYKAMGKAIDCDEVVSFSLPFDILSDAMSKASKHLKE